MLRVCPAVTHLADSANLSANLMPDDPENTAHALNQTIGHL
jgi:hypothetical protein